MLQNPQQLIAQLINLEFSERDAEVYLALIEVGATTAGPLIQATNLHRNIVYTSLNHLIARKLVSTKIIRGRKQFVANDPQPLTEEYRAKTEDAVQIAKTIKHLQSDRQLEEITVHQGNEEYLSLLNGLIRSLPKGATKYVLGTGGEEFMRETMRPIWKKYHKVATDQNISIKMIAYENQRKAIAEDIANPPIYSVRYLPENIENPSGIHIYPEANTVLNIMYSSETEPVTAIKIQNKKLVQGYLNLFNNLWKIGKE